MSVKYTTAKSNGNARFNVIVGDSILKFVNGYDILGKSEDCKVYVKLPYELKDRRIEKNRVTRSRNLSDRCE